MKDVLELRQERAKLIEQARELDKKADSENRNLNAEEKAQYDKIFADVEELADRIERKEKLEEVERDLEVITEERANMTSKDVEKAQTDVNNDKVFANRAFQKFLTHGVKALNEKEARALSVGTDNAGGYTVAPEDFRTQLLKARENIVFMRKYATILTMAPAKKLTMPKLTTDIGDPTWTTEILVGSEDSTIAFGQFELDPNPLARYIKVSKELLRQSVINIDGLIRERFAYKFGVVEENNYLNGDGSSKPLGVFTASASGIPTSRDFDFAATSALDADTIVKAPDQLAEQYQANLRWIMHRTIKQAISVLKDSNNQYLLKPGLEQGAPDTLVGYPVHRSEYAPSTISADAYVAVLGDFSQYYILEDLDLQIQRLDELFALTNQVGFVARQQIDGKPADANAFVRLAMASA